MTKEYAYGNGERLALFSDPNTSTADIYYYHNDHLGTPKVVTDSTGAIVWQGDYTPFGEVTETVNLIEQPFRFPGQYFDSETNLHYNYFRDYDPSIGRYIQSDPIGFEGGINTYGYAAQNPTMFFDPFGLEIVGTWGVSPQLIGFDFSVGPDGLIVDDGSVKVNVTVSGTGIFKFTAHCADTCTGENWDENMSVNVSASYTGYAAIPGMCSAIALATQYPGRTGGSPGRVRAGKRVAAICAGILAINVNRAANAAKSQVRSIIDNGILSLIETYLSLGATAICKNSRE